jgi:hypothetical protein
MSIFLAGQLILLTAGAADAVAVDNAVAVTVGICAVITIG